MRIFLIVWIGQFISLLGSKLSEFALAFWAYQQVTSVTHIACLIVLMYVPNILVSPLAGALVDRWNRRTAMLYSDVASGLCSVGILLLAFTDRLQLWHIYLTVPILAIAGAFQTPAYTAAIAQLVPPPHQGRANGMADLPIATARIVTPLLAGILMGVIKLEGILLLDSVTFVIAMGTLLCVRFPDIPKQAVKVSSQSLPSLKQLWQETLLSWRYIKAQPGLFQLWVFIILTYWTIGMFDIAFWLLTLRSGVVQFGVVLSAGGFGLLAGSLTMSVWGGTRRRIQGMLWLTLLQGGVIILMGFGSLRSLFIASLGAFIYLFCDPIIMGSNKAIWQRKVPQGLQGRVFAVQLMVQRSAMIPAYLITGLSIDYVFEPLLRQSPPFKAIAETLAGAATPNVGISVFLILLGIGKIGITLMAAQNPLLLSVESPLTRPPFSVEASRSKFR